MKSSSSSGYLNLFLLVLFIVFVSSFNLWDYVFVSVLFLILSHLFIKYLNAVFLKYLGSPLYLNYSSLSNKGNLAFVLVFNIIIYVLNKLIYSLFINSSYLMIFYLLPTLFLVPTLLLNRYMLKNFKNQVKNANQEDLESFNKESWDKIKSRFILSSDYKYLNKYTNGSNFLLSNFIPNISLYFISSFIYSFFMDFYFRTDFNIFYLIYILFFSLSFIYYIYGLLSFKSYCVTSFKVVKDKYIELKGIYDNPSNEIKQDETPYMFKKSMPLESLASKLNPTPISKLSISDYDLAKAYATKLLTHDKVLDYVTKFREEVLLDSDMVYVRNSDFVKHIPQWSKFYNHALNYYKLSSNGSVSGSRESLFRMIQQGFDGETRLKSVMDIELPGKVYYGVTLKNSEGETVELDALVIHDSGLTVIESKDFKADEVVIDNSGYFYRVRRGVEERLDTLNQINRANGILRSIFGSGTLIKNILVLTNEETRVRNNFTDDYLQLVYYNALPFKLRSLSFIDISKIDSIKGILESNSTGERRYKMYNLELYINNLILLLKSDIEQLKSYISKYDGKEDISVFENALSVYRSHLAALN